MGILEKIKEIESEISRTQKNKATESHLGRLKGKLARYRTQLIEGPTAGGGSKAPAFEVRKAGDVRVAMVGFPSAGKSTLLTKVTTTDSAVGAYEFTTLTCVPGVLHVHGTEIQVLDLPGIVEGASEGRGRGRQVIATARTADMILMVLEAPKADEHRPILERELENIGIRLNQKRPNVLFTKKPGGSSNVIHFTATIPLTKGCDEATVRAVLHDYKIFNADVVIREDITVDQFIDVIEGNRQYMRCLYVYNKIDLSSMEHIAAFAARPHSVVISGVLEWNLERFVAVLWRELALSRVYCKKRGSPPDLQQPFILRPGTTTVQDMCARIHRDLAQRFAYALVWGTSVKHDGQRVGAQHVLDDQDVVQIMAAARETAKASLKPAAKKKGGGQVGRHRG
eukprot:TRINITY_DN22485_c0_g1_i1.p2 TRINITY_DN22485_c0_g1~~TRINITY_DN22485_c0_g1_i1.p2  ORF type:complete len:397 (+),score=79.26 TRINITY_DN22485_c0_g1_i1:78-1268(+)